MITVFILDVDLTQMLMLMSCAKARYIVQVIAPQKLAAHLALGLQRMFDSFGYSIDSTLSGVQTAIRMFGQGLTCTAHAQYIHNCSSALAMSISMSMKRHISVQSESFLN